MPLQTGESIDSLLRKRKSPMAGLGSVFVGVGKKYGVDPRLLVGISGIESGFGLHLYGSFNAWGWGPGKDFGSWQEGISTVARGLKTGYLNQGLTDPYSIAKRYAPASDGNNPQHWADTVSQFMRELGATVPSRGKAAAVAGGQPTVAPLQLDQGGLRAGLVASLQDTAAHGGHVDTGLMLRSIAGGLQVDRAAPVRASAGNTASTVPLAQGPRSGGRVTIRPGADRPGVGLNSRVLDFARQVSSIYGKPIQIGTGTRHNQYVVGTHRQSAHWSGLAADIPAVGEELTRMGRAALVAAGMPASQAAKVNGGVFNLGGYQIIFNSMTGGNHFDHLHVGIRG